MSLAWGYYLGFFGNTCALLYSGIILQVILLICLQNDGFIGSVLSQDWHANQTSWGARSGSMALLVICDPEAHRPSV